MKQKKKIPINFLAMNWRSRIHDSFTSVFHGTENLSNVSTFLYASVTDNGGLIYADLAINEIKWNEIYFSGYLLYEITIDINYLSGWVATSK